MLRIACMRWSTTLVRLAATHLKVAAADEQINWLPRRRLNGLDCFVNLIKLSVTASLDCHLHGVVQVSACRSIVRTRNPRLATAILVCCA